MNTMSIHRVAVLTLLVAFSPHLRAGEEPQVQPDVVYGHKDGMALTFDVVRPARANGAAVLWIQSGGWYSVWVDAKALAAGAKPYLDKGYTIFIVRHGSAPKYTIPEITQDVRRSVRFIRMKARDFGINPDRLGVLGGSAGGHLSLLLATTADEGDPKAADEVLRHSSRVAAVVALYPPTDIRDWTTNPPEAIRRISTLKPPLTFDAKLEPDYSPLLKVTDTTAPTLLIHGDKDALVPLEHSEKMLAALQKAGVDCKLEIIKGAGHGFSPKQNQEIVMPAILEWLDKHLAVENRP
jgi:acetyl esterase/lipase